VPRTEYDVRRTERFCETANSRDGRQAQPPHEGTRYNSENAKTHLETSVAVCLM